MGLLFAIVLIGGFGVALVYDHSKNGGPGLRMPSFVPPPPPPQSTP